MKKKSDLLVVFTAFSLLLPFAGCGPQKSAEESAPSPKKETLVIALKPDKDPDKMLAEKANLAAHLSAKLGRPVEVIVPLSASVIHEGFANGTIDLGYLSATDMIAARKAGVARVLLVGEINGRRDYQSYWVALEGSDYRSIEDLRGKPVAFSSRTSTSGYMVPHADLIRRGLLDARAGVEGFFGKGNVWYGTGYVSAVQQVLNGDAEAAAVSYYVLDEDRHLTAEERAKLRKVDQQGPVPTHVLAVRSSLDPGEADALKSALLEMNASASELRNQVFTSKLVETDESDHLAPLEESLKLIGVGK